VTPTFVLHVFVGTARIQTVDIGDSGLSIGRDATNHLVLKDPTVGKSHGRLLARGSHIILVDLGTPGGTHVRGRRISSAELTPGDEFRIGPYRLQLVKSAQTPAPRPPEELHFPEGLSALVGITDLQAVCETLLERAMALAEATRGFVVLLQGEVMSPVIIRQGATAAEREEFSRTLCESAVKKRTPLALTGDEALVAMANIPSLAGRFPRSIFAIPLHDSDDILGVLYMEADSESRTGLDPVVLEQISQVGGRALRAAVERHQVIHENERWRWIAMHTGDTPDPFRSSQSQRMQEVLAVIDRAAAEDVTVLLRGETGTGKEVLAQAIHARSPRARGPFVAINCAALPRELLESEIFGHERGAFTGATGSRPGRLELAQGGTLLLDELGDMPLDLQAKLLRALETRQFERVGGRGSIQWDGRLLAATNCDLESSVASGTFRKDLYYRLNVLSVEIPPLRERPEDIELLVHDLLLSCNRKYRRKIYGVTPAALAALQAYSWPGNVRELRNVIERVFFVEKSDVVTPLSLTFAPALEEMNSTGVKAPVEVFGPLEDFMGEQERDYILRVLVHTDGNVTKAASVLGLARVSLQRKLKHMGIRGQGNDGDDP
jgi:transcriptional regulator with GAF, ATPase, and Fis domain